MDPVRQFQAAAKDFIRAANEFEGMRSCRMPDNEAFGQLEQAFDQLKAAHKEAVRAGIPTPSPKSFANRFIPV